MSSTPDDLSLRCEAVFIALETTPRVCEPQELDRATALHECGHAIIGLIRKLAVLRIDASVTRILRPLEPHSGYLQMLYAGYCAEVAFGLDPMKAQRCSSNDLRAAERLFPGHNPAVEVAKVLSLVYHHKQVIDRASTALLRKGTLSRNELLAFLEDA